MANQQDRDYQNLRRQIKAAGEDVVAFELAWKQANNQVGEQLKVLKTMQGYLEGLENTMSGLYGSLRGITSEFKGQATVLNKVRGAFRQLEDIAQDLKFDEQEINDLNASQLKKLEEKFKKNRQILDQEARALVNQNSYAKVLNTQIQTLIQQGKTQDEINNYATTYLGNTQKLSDEQKSLLQLYYDQGNTLDAINSKIDERIQKEKEINNALGVGGAAVQGISTLMSSLGMNSGIFSDAVQEAEEAMRDAAKDGGSKLQVLMAGLGPLAKGFGKALLDPAVIIDRIIRGFLEVNKASVELERLTGQNSQALAGANFEVASTVDVLEIAVELTEQLGINAQNAFSSDVLAGAAGLKVEMGLAADEAGGLAVIAQTTTGDINGMVDGIVSTTSAFNKANRAAVSQGQVLKDVAKASDSIKLSLGNNPQLIAKAASAARRLGLELKDVDEIASSLMNFEDSISAELEAELLTGKQLNLERARELALKNDLAGLGEEIFKNSADVAEFGKMNRIQQEAYAKSLGLTKDQLARIAYQRAIEKGMTDEQAAAAAGVTAENMRQMDVQERISKALDKLAQAFAPILDIVADIADLIGWIITPIAGVVGYVVKLLDTFGLIKVPLLLIGGIMLSGSVAKGIGSMVRGIRDFSKGILSAIKNFDILNAKQAISGKAGGLLDTIKGKFKEGLAGKAEDAAGGLAGKAKEKLEGKAEGLADKISGDKAAEAGDKVAGVADKTKNVKAGTGVKDFLTNLGKGLEALAKSFKAIGPQGFVYLAAGLALVTGAVIGIGYALNLAAPAIEAFGKVITAVFGGIATLITAVADGFVKIMGAVTMESIGPMLLLGPALFGIAAGLGAIAVTGLLALPALLALTALGTVGGGVTSVFGGGEEKIGAGKEGEGNSSMAAVNEKLTTLINLVRDGQDIYLDANKVGRAQSLAVLKSS